jgi:membrane-associated protein
MVNDALAWLLDTVASVDPVLRTLLAGVAVLLETSVLVGLVVPGDTIVVVASLATPDPTVDPWPAIALVVAVVLGALGGESIGFLLGRHFGPRIRHSRLGRRIGEHNWVRAERLLERRGGPAVFISRFLPVLHSLVPLTVGISGMAYRRFLAWTLPACLLWSSAYVAAGATAGTVTRRLLSQQLHSAGYVFAAILLFFVMVVWLGKRIAHHVSERHMHRNEHQDPEPDERP